MTVIDAPDPVKEKRVKRAKLSDWLIEETTYALDLKKTCPGETIQHEIKWQHEILSVHLSIKPKETFKRCYDKR